MKNNFVKELIFDKIPNKCQNDFRNKRITNKPNEDFYYEYSNEHLYYKSEIALWKAVILQALVDLNSNSKKKIANTYRIKALMWFNLKNEEFLTVCNYAGLSPKYVYEKSIKIKNNNKFFM